MKDAIEQIVTTLVHPFRNLFILMDYNRHAPDKRVSLDYWLRTENLGDAISPVIVNYILKSKYNIDLQKPISCRKHLYAVGSNLTAGIQDCCVWGSGVANLKRSYRLKNRTLDIRLVRGPLTMLALQEYGYMVPSCYGDPGVLLQDIYNPEVQQRYTYGLIVHVSEERKINVRDDCHRLDIKTTDYEKFIYEMKECKTIVSSSLHGIIFAESYGIPAILLRPYRDLYKYYDWYLSTGRSNFPVADSIEEAFQMMPPPLPDLSEMKETLYKTFPIDLFEISNL